MDGLGVRAKKGRDARTRAPGSLTLSQVVHGKETTPTGGARLSAAERGEGGASGWASRERKVGRQRSFEPREKGKRRREEDGLGQKGIGKREREVTSFFSTKDSNNSIQI